MFSRYRVRYWNNVDDKEEIESGIVYHETNDTASAAAALDEYYGQDLLECTIEYISDHPHCLLVDEDAIKKIKEENY